MNQGLSTEDVSRRRFHLGVIYSLMATIGAALGIPAIVYLFFPPKSRKAEEWVEVADVASLSNGVPEEIVFRKNRVDGWKISSEKTTAWVLKKTGGEILAFAPQCTHLGCAYRYEEQKKTFLCPCHTSNFDLDGNVIDGPAPRPLDRYAVKIDGNKLLLGAVHQSPEA